MTVAERLQRGQQAAMPREDLTPYAGQWVALRDGLVVAAELDPLALRHRDDVRDDDILMPVPSGKPGALLIL
jgi:hypothetical protein